MSGARTGAKQEKALRARVAVRSASRFVARKQKSFPWQSVALRRTSRFVGRIEEEVVFARAAWIRQVASPMPPRDRQPGEDSQAGAEIRSIQTLQPTRGDAAEI